MVQAVAAAAVEVAAAVVVVRAVAVVVVGDHVDKSSEFIGGLNAA